jgi:hypothetical protein
MNLGIVQNGIADRHRTGNAAGHSLSESERSAKQKNKRRKENVFYHRQPPYRVGSTLYPEARPRTGKNPELF